MRCRRLIWISGLDAQVHGNFITIAWGTFEIAKGCSGLHFFEVGLAIAALWGELDEQTPAGRIKLMALMGAMAIVCNWIRVVRPDRDRLCQPDEELPDHRRALRLRLGAVRGDGGSVFLRWPIGSSRCRRRGLAPEAKAEEGSGHPRRCLGRGRAVAGCRPRVVGSLEACRPRAHDSASAA